MEKKIAKIKHRIDLYNKGFLIVKYNLDPIDIKDGINWNYIHGSNPNTYQTYLHSLSIVDDFIDYGIYFKKDIYIKQAGKIIKDWIANGNNPSENSSWNEHSVSSRIKSIIKYQENSGKFKLSQSLFQKHLTKHCLFLFNRNNYKKNNHGLMMDEALLYASNHIIEPKKKLRYTMRAMDRIETAIYRDLTFKGVHLENSPEYHLLFLALIRRIEKTMNSRDLKFNATIQSILKNANAFKSILIQPNLSYPYIGDTGIIKPAKIEKKYDDFFDIDAGLVIFQNRHNKHDEKSSYLTLVCGYRNKTHKHFDDLSITYYDNGEEILVDSGKYGYSNMDDIRSYIISPKAHSTVYLKGKSYELSTNPIPYIDALKITNVFTNSEYKIIKAINNMYSEVEIERVCILTKENVLVILDKIISRNKETYIQNFNFNDKAVIEIVNQHEYQIDVNNNVYRLMHHSNNKRFIGSKISQGLISRQFGKKIKNEKIEFSHEGKEITMVTSLATATCSVNVSYLQNNLLSIGVNDNYYRIPL